MKFPDDVFIHKPSADLAYCSCGWKGKSKDLIHKRFWDDNSYSSYYEDFCPECEDGEIVR